jgi:hypothetical protein
MMQMFNLSGTGSSGDSHMGVAGASPVASTSTSASTSDPCHDTSRGLSMLIGEFIPFLDELWSSDAASLASTLMGELVVAFSKELRFETSCVDIVRNLFVLSVLVVALSIAALLSPSRDSFL